VSRANGQEVEPAQTTASICDRLRDRLASQLQRRGLFVESWSPLNSAAYREMVTLLSPYLFSSQGDRVSLVHAFAAQLPTHSTPRGLWEKAILRRWARDVVPPKVLGRPKQPNRAPDIPPSPDPTSIRLDERRLG
jgi:asparagine synthase